VPPEEVLPPVPRVPLGVEPESPHARSDAPPTDAVKRSETMRPKWALLVITAEFSSRDSVVLFGITISHVLLANERRDQKDERRLTQSLHQSVTILPCATSSLKMAHGKFRENHR
jgi:hypothetical protein